MSDGKAFLDTNILVYAFDRSDPHRQRPAADLVKSLVAQEVAVISVQVLKELFVTVTRKIRTPLAEPEAARLVEDLYVMQIVDDTLPLFRRALELKRRHTLSLWDATVVAAAAAAGCERLYSEDLRAGAVIDGVTITNPFHEPVPLRAPRGPT